MQTRNTRIRNIIAASIVCFSSSASAQNSEFEQAVKTQCSYIDWKLVYAVALTESAKYMGSGKVQAQKFAFNSPDGSKYLSSNSEATRYLNELRRKYDDWQIDVGAMQLNLKWNKHRVESPMSLLDPETNIRVGCEVLKETLASAEHDIELGIGRYHHWKDESRTRAYGKRVMSIWEGLKVHFLAQR